MKIGRDTHAGPAVTILLLALGGAGGCASLPSTPGAVWVRLPESRLQARISGGIGPGDTIHLMDGEREARTVVLGELDEIEVYAGPKSRLKNGALWAGSSLLVSTPLGAAAGEYGGLLVPVLFVPSAVLGWLGAGPRWRTVDLSAIEDASPPVLATDRVGRVVATGDRLRLQMGQEAQIVRFQGIHDQEMLGTEGEANPVRVDWTPSGRLEVSAGRQSGFGRALRGSAIGMVLGAGVGAVAGAVFAESSGWDRGFDALWGGLAGLFIGVIPGAVWGASTSGEEWIQLDGPLVPIREAIEN